MSRRLTRKQIKKDEFRLAIGSALDFLRRHSRALLWSLVGVAALVVVALALAVYSSHASQLASERLAQAVKVHEAPIDAADPQPENEENPSFASEAARRARAKELFEELRDDYGLTSAAKLSAVYLAELALQEGDVAGARELWNEYLQSEKRDGLSIAVRLNLISLDREQGRAEELVERLQSELENGRRSLPEDALLYELAVTLESLGRAQEARESYSRILDDYPGSPYAARARQRSEQIVLPDTTVAQTGIVDPF